VKRLVSALVLSLCVFLLPAASRAALSISVPDTTGYFPSDGPWFVDLVFRETGTRENERLTVYDLGLSLVRPSGVTGGVNLVTYDVNDPNFDPSIFAASPNFVFPRNNVTLVESDANHIQLNFENIAAGAAGQTNVADGMTAARIYYTVAPHAPCGVYRLVISPDLSVFANADAEAIPVDVSDSGTLIDCPEPGTLSLLALSAGLLGTRRATRVPSYPSPNPPRRR
jgi:hypothetical protein